MCLLLLNHDCTFLGRIFHTPDLWNLFIGMIRLYLHHLQFLCPRPYPAQERLHVRDRMVAEDAVTSFKHKYVAAVIKFLLIPFKKEKSPASTTGRRMRQRDAGRAVLISSQRQIQSQPSKKQLWVWVRHKSAGIHRLPLRHNCRCRHDRRRTEQNPRMFPCTALSCPVTVGESPGLQQACGRLHSSCEIHFGSTRGDDNGSDISW